MPDTDTDSHATHATHSGPPESPDPTETFAAHRGLLFGVAYRVLGSVADAEDAVQDAWLRWRDVRHDEVADPRAFLVRVVTRLAIDRLRRASTRRETYVGPWLPEPLLTGPDDAAEHAELADSVSMAMLVVLETLSPLERAVFVLREAFGLPYAEIGEAVGRGAAAVRQLAHRAREHVHAQAPRYDADRATRREATERFLEATVSGDLAGLMAVLAPDVTLVSDGGGKVTAARRPIEGRDSVARFVHGIAAKGAGGGSVRLVDLNGGPGILAVAVDGTPVIAVSLDVAGGLVTTVRMVVNPDKLGGVRTFSPTAVSDQE